MNEPTPRRKITHVSPRVAQLYVARSEKTVARDLAALEAAQLVVREGEIVMPNFDLVLELLPMRAKRS